MKISNKLTPNFDKLIVCERLRAIGHSVSVGGSSPNKNEIIHTPSNSGEGNEMNVMNCEIIIKYFVNEMLNKWNWKNILL